MAKSYEQLMQQIDTLKQRAHAAKLKEAAGVIKRMKEAIEFYGLTAEDLGLAGTRRATAGQPAAKKTRGTAGRKPAKKAGVVRFKDDAGHTWTGRGPRPRWFQEAIANGKTPQDLAA